MANPLLYKLEIAGQVLVARTVAGREAISEPFALRVALTLEDGIEIDPDEVVKSAAAVILERDAVERRIVGLVSEVAVTESTSGRPDLELTLEPRFALSRYRKNVKAYLHKHGPDIVSEVLGELGVAFELRLIESYPVRPYTVQHRETDYHFVSRILEEEGIFYFFDEQGTMVLGDAASAYDSAGPLPFRQAASMDEHEDAVVAMGGRVRASAGKVSLRDWTADAPSLSQDVSAAGPTSGGSEFYDFPGEYDEPGGGQRIADRIAAAMGCFANSFLGRATHARFAHGRTFVLEDAPPGVPPGEYVLTAVEHDFDRNREGMTIAFEALRGDVTFRPLNRHQEPILPNPVTGIVTGPPGEDIHTDELGRVKVHFPWDRLQPRDDTCSHWIPVLQDNNGHSVSVPRIGWEVLVHYLEGDPDRPVVLGRVYNAEDQFYTTLPEKKSVTALRSLSSPTRDGNNVIELEDLSGVEHILFFAEKDQDVVVANNKDEHIMLSEQRTILRDETISVGSDETITVNNDSAPRVEGNVTLSVGGNRTHELGDGEQLSVQGSHVFTIGGKHIRRIANTDAVNAKAITNTVGGVIVETSIKANASNAGSAFITTVGGAIIEVAGKEKVEGAQIACADTTGGVLFTKASKNLQTAVGTHRITNVGGLMKIQATERATLSATATINTNSVVATLSGDVSLGIEIGDTRLRIGDGQIELVTKSTINMELASEAEFGADESDQN